MLHDGAWQRDVAALRLACGLRRPNGTAPHASACGAVPGTYKVRDGLGGCETEA